MDFKQEFLDIFKEHIHREGSDKLLEFLLSTKSDFFTAPASTRYHSSFEGGLLQHSLNVYHCLKENLSTERAKTLYKMDVTDESIALVALMHDLCKVNFYKTDFRNFKNEQGVWEKIPYFSIDDKLPYGHGEKSVYILTGYMKLSREEAFAIRYHMGFSGLEDKNAIGKVFEQFPLAFALCVADMEASYYLEK